MNLKSIFESSQIVFSKLQDVYDKLDYGQHYKINDLIRKISDELNLLQENVAPLVQYFIRNHDDVKVENGRTGGAYKGARIQNKKIKSVATDSELVNKINGVSTKEDDNEAPF